MSSVEGRSELVAELADEFAERFRRGERPPISEFVRRCPEAEEEIREVFSAIAHVERLAPAPHDERPTPNLAADVLHMPTALGDFRIVREVGRGGMGIVYEAEQVSLGRRVALKVLPPHLLTGDRQRKRFEREAKAAARLHHTNIVPVFGVGEQEGLHYYVMQFIHGLGLDAVLTELRRLRADSEAGRPTTRDTPHPPRAVAGAGLQEVAAVEVAQALLTGHFDRTVLVAEGSESSDMSSGEDAAASVAPQPATPQPPPALPDTAVGRLSETLHTSGAFALPGQTTQTHVSSRRVYWESVARIGVQTAQALQHAHDQGIIHRDIKPGNLLLDTRGQIWVTDFGLAKAADQQDLTHTGDVLGTLRYMAPEQFDGQADGRSDLYSLGLTLYELLALKPAFDETDRHRLIKQVTTGTPPRLRHIDHHIPRDLETILHKAIDREPSHRYQTAGEMADDLQRYLGDEPIQAKWVSPVTRFRRWCKRNPAIAGLTTTIALLLVTAAVASSLAAVRFQELATRNANLVTEKTGLADELQAALNDVQANLTLANTETQRAEQALARVTTEQQRAEGNLDLALTALDAVYLDAIGTEKLLGPPRAGPGDPDFTPSVSPPLTNLEKELIRRGLTFYDQFAQQNAATPRAALQTAQAYYRVGLLQTALQDRGAAQAACNSAISRFQLLAQTEPTRAELHQALGSARLALAWVEDDWPDAQIALRGAIAAYSRQIELHPDDASAFTLRAICHRALNEWEATIADIVRATELAPDDPLVHAQAANCLAAADVTVRDFERAILFGRRALELAPNNVDVHLLLAHTYSNCRDFQASLKHADRAIQLDPVNGSAHNHRARALLELGDAQGALAAAQQAVDLSPETAFPYLTRAAVLLRFERYDEVIADCTRASEIEPSGYASYARRAEAHLRRGEYELAIDDVNRCLDRRPGFYYVLKRRAAACFHLGRFEESLADLKAALALNPDDTSAILWIPPHVAAGCPDESFKRGLIALADGVVEHSSTPARARMDRIRVYMALGEDERIVQEEIQSDPRWKKYQTYSYRDRAAAFFRLGQFDRALEDLRSALQITPDDPKILVRIAPTEVARRADEEFRTGLLSLAGQAIEHPDTDKALAHQYRAEIAEALGRPEAIDDYTWLIENQPDQPAHLLGRARLLRHLGESARADKDLAKASELGAHDAKLQLQLAQLHRDAGADQLALEHFTKTIELVPAEAPYWNARGMCYHRLGRHAEARDDYSRSIELDEQKPAYWSNRALSQLNLRDYQAAISDATQAIELRTDHALAHQWRAKARAALNQWDAAIADYTRLIELKPHEPAHLLDRAQARRAAGDAAGAEADFESYLQPFNAAVDDDERDWQAWNQRGLALANWNRWDQALSDFDKAAELASDRPAVHKNRATLLLRTSRWGEAADALARVVELKPAEWRTEYELALCALKASELSRYHDACRRMLESATPTTGALEANFIAWTCALAPAALDEYDAVLSLAMTTLETAPDNQQYANSLGAVLYRAGRHEAALTRLTQLAQQLEQTEAQPHSSPAYCWYFLAMTHEALGHTNEAQIWLKRANDWTKQVLNSATDPSLWNRQLTLELLRDEATALIDPADERTNSRDDDAQRPPAPPETEPTEQIEDNASD